jgi:hypothetical protein
VRTHDLGAELDEIARLARTGAWRDARSRLDAWTSRTEALLLGARRAARASRAPLEARNQFRALLEAYQVKARRLGVVEDPELEQTFARAHEALYTAPTDLALVAQLIRRYQELIGSARRCRDELRAERMHGDDRRRLLRRVRDGPRPPGGGGCSE